MKFVSYTNWNQLPKSADSLFSEGAKDSIFFTRPWFENLIKATFEDGQSLLLACVVDKEDDQADDETMVLAILPIMKRESEYWHSLSNNYSSLFNLLLANHNQQEILKCLVQGLHQLPFTQLKLDPIGENDKNMKNLQLAMESSGFTCLPSFRFYNWFHRLQGQSFETYMASRPSKVRNTITRKQRKLDREHGYNIRLFMNDDLQQAMADYNTIYQASWKANERFAGFAESLVSHLAKHGWLRLAILYVEGEPAAAQIWFVVHRKANIFRLVYDANWKQYSPGSILTHFLMEHVIDTDKVEEIDFLTGNDAYKKEWMTKRRERWSMICAKKQEPESKLTRVLEFLKGLLSFKH